MRARAHCRVSSETPGSVVVAVDASRQGRPDLDSVIAATGQYAQLATSIIDHQGVDGAEHVHADHDRRLVLEIPEPEDVEIAERDLEIGDLEIAEVHRRS